MATNDTQRGLSGDLSAAIDDLQQALQRAADATASIRAIVPRVGAITGLFDELEHVIESGRRTFGTPAGQPGSTAPYTRPTLVPTATQPAQSEWSTQAQPEQQPSFEQPQNAQSDAPSAEALTCFRLEFDSRPGPLDLRAVDDAVSEHPAVRDVALLDYDGRKATLKVWIVGSASPSDVQQALTERASQIFEGGNDVTIVALEDVA